MLLEAGRVGVSGHALRQALCGRHPDSAAVSVASFAGCGADHLVDGRKIRGADLADAFYLQPDQDTVQGDATDERLRAVYGIYDPAVVSVRPFGLPVLFSQNRVLRKAHRYPIPDEPLGLTIGHRYGRIVGLELGTRRLCPEIAERELPSLVSGLDAELQVRSQVHALTIASFSCPRCSNSTLGLDCLSLSPIIYAVLCLV